MNLLCFHRRPASGDICWEGGVPHPSRKGGRGVPPSFLTGEGGTPSFLIGSTSGLPDEGYSIPGQDRRYPIPGQGRGVPWGTAQSRSGPRSGQGTTSSVAVRNVTECWMGYPHPSGVNGVPSTSGFDGGTPPHTHQETEQHSEHLLRCGRVCLLRSRRRTFLLKKSYMIFTYISS